MSRPGRDDPSTTGDFFADFADKRITARLDEFWITWRSVSKPSVGEVVRLTGGKEVVDAEVRECRRVAKGEYDVLLKLVLEAT